MKNRRVRAIPMSDPVPPQRQHRTDLGTKVKSDATLKLAETDDGLTGMGAALGTPPVIAAIVGHELGPEVVGEDPLFSGRIYEKRHNGSRAQPALERGVPQPEVSQGYMPMMWEFFSEPFDIRPDGAVHAPQQPGPGFTLRADALRRFGYVEGPEYAF